MTLVVTPAVRLARPRSAAILCKMGSVALKVNEIFYSIQGESTHAGLPCVFVRLTGCNLRCVWCDTAYAFHEGRSMEIDEIVEQVRTHGCRLVELTGGEPLLQPEAIPLMEALLDAGHDVLIETGAACRSMRCRPGFVASST